jgi:hypothetical protein
MRRLNLFLREQADGVDPVKDPHHSISRLVFGRDPNSLPGEGIEALQAPGPASSLLFYSFLSGQRTDGIYNVYMVYVGTTRSVSADIPSRSSHLVQPSPHLQALLGRTDYPICQDATAIVSF